MRADLRREPAGDLRHRREKGQGARGRGDGLVGDGRDAALEQILGLRAIRREVQIGEQHLTAAQPLALDCQRLLHLHDHLARGEDLLGAVDDAASGGRVLVIAQSRAYAGAALDQVELGEPSVPVYCCVSVEPYGDVRKLLVEGLTSPVRWRETVLAMQSAGETRFLEVGPGKVLAGLVRRIIDGADATSLKEAARA